jgi:subtilase family serine protease
MSLLHRHRTVALLLATASVALGGLVSAATAAAASRRAIPGTHPFWAVSSHRKAAAAGNGAVNVRVYLAGQDPAGLAAYAKSVSDPSNGAYGDYLKPAQVQSRFAASSAQIATIESWLTGAGFTINKVANRVGGFVAASGTVAQASQAFGVSFADYIDSTGQTARAPGSAATVPSSVSDAVLAVSGLDTGTHEMKPGATTDEPPPGPNYWVAPPTSSYYGQNIATNEPTANGQHWPWNVSGYTPQQIRGAYNVTQSGMTGKGQTVAVVDAYASPTMQGDANKFSKVTANQPFRNGQYNEYLPKAGFYDGGNNECGAQGWYGEETLDVESVHDMAPDADVNFVAARSCNDDDLLAADAKIVNKGLANIVTDSFGEPYDDATVQNVWDQLFEAGAAEGIGFLFSSGDEGYEDPTIEDPGISDQLQVDYPTSSPWVTAVGGTSVAIGKSNNWESEIPWGTLIDPLAAAGTSWTYTPPPPYNADTYDGSSGGGVSTAYTQPWYQKGVVPNSLATEVPEGSTTTPMRVVPDISALADPSTGMLVGQTTLQPNGKTYAFSLSRIGGTSVASPTFAGILADAEQAAGHDLGFVNPVLYSRSGSSAYHDVTENPSGTYQVRNNYTDPDTATGPLLTFLRAQGIDGEDLPGDNAALPGTTGYDDSTGLGSPNRFVQSFGH